MSNGTTWTSTSAQAVRTSYTVGISRTTCSHAGAQLCGITAVSLLTAMHPVQEGTFQKLPTQMGTKFLHTLLLDQHLFAHVDFGVMFQQPSSPVLVTWRWETSHFALHS